MIVNYFTLEQIKSLRAVTTFVYSATVTSKKFVVYAMIEEIYVATSTEELMNSPFLSIQLKRRSK